MQEQIMNVLNNYLDADNNILFAYLFGSYAKGKEKESSDIDIAVYLQDINKNNYFDYKIKIKLDLEDILKHEIDIVILNFAPPFLKHQVISYGKLLKSNDNKKLNEFKIRSFYEYCDYKNVMNIVLKANKKRIKEKIEDGG